MKTWLHFLWESNAFFFFLLLIAFFLHIWCDSFSSNCALFWEWLIFWCIFTMSKAEIFKKHLSFLFLFVFYFQTQACACIAYWFIIEWRIVLLLHKFWEFSLPPYDTYIIYHFTCQILQLWPLWFVNIPCKP